MLGALLLPHELGTETPADRFGPGSRDGVLDFRNGCRHDVTVVGGRALAVVATIAMLAYMAWVIRDSRKITAAKDRDRRRGPDPFLSGRRPNRALGSGPGASERHDNHPIG
jgi:hypothetical protein